MNSGLQSKKILVAPLDWGLGHATRCIPIINELIRLNCNLWIAAGGKSFLLLRKEFPLLPFFELQGFSVVYHKAKSDFRFTMLRQVPAFAASVRQEHRWLDQIMDEHQFDIIISDNRYGLYHHRAVSIIITHQLAIRTGLGRLADWLVRKLNYRQLRKFDACWVPDFAGKENLAGALSHPVTVPPETYYIGALSRFEKKDLPKKYDLLVLLSGPEPRRSIWEQALLAELNHYNGRALLVRGLPDDAPPIKVAGGTEIVNFLSADALGAALQQSERVICRSGYTSVMDLVKLQQKAILVPTPGQPEQEYLAQWLMDRGIFYSCTEDRFSLLRCLREAENFSFRFSEIDSFGSDYKIHLRHLLASPVKGKQAES